MPDRNSKKRCSLHTVGSLLALALTAMTSALVALAAPAGCVRRTLTISTTPPDAVVYLNDQEIGRSDVSVDFLWYGDYDVVIRKEGFKTLKTNWVIQEPWYQVVPIDFFFEVFWAGDIHDVRGRHFTLEERKDPTTDELIERAHATRDDALTVVPTESVPSTTAPSETVPPDTGHRNADKPNTEEPNTEKPGTAEPEAGKPDSGPPETVPSIHGPSIHGPYNTEPRAND